MADDAVVETIGLTKNYTVGGETVHAVAGVDLRIARGEFVAVMGKSGSGKSTFLNLLGCLDRPSGGRYLLDGEDVAGLATDALAAVRNRKIGFVFQSFNLLARTTAADNVALPMLYAGVKRQARTERAAALLAQLGLADRAGHAPTQLSGGQQQRVAIARALANNPALILADEPTGALDTHTGAEIMRILHELNRGGRTIVMVTHEAEVAREARRVVEFRDGAVIADYSVPGPTAGAA